MTVPHPQGSGSAGSDVPITAATTRGRALIIAGSILIAVAMIVGVVGFVLTVGRIDVTAFQRDVVTEDQTDAAIPGVIEFQVFEPLGDDEDQTVELRVGLGVSAGVELDADCTLLDDSGERIPLSTPKQNDAFWRDSPERFSVMGTAKLAPGSYSAECVDGAAPDGAVTEGSDSESTDARFTVGRVAGPDDYATVFEPALWFVLVAAVCALAFFVGLVLLVIGLSQRASARRQGSPPPTVQFAPPDMSTQRPMDRPAQPEDGGSPASGPPLMPPPMPPQYQPPTPPESAPADPASQGEQPASDGWTIPPSKKQQ